MDVRTYSIKQVYFADMVTYLLIGDERALLIDTGIHIGDLAAVVGKLTDRKVTVANTHAHLDHIGHNADFEQILRSAKDDAVYKMHTDPAYTREMMKRSYPPFLVSLLRGPLEKMVNVPRESQRENIADGDTIDLGGRKLTVIETPGHSPGAVCFLEEQSGWLFSGDTGGDWGMLLDLDGCLPPEIFLSSVEKLKALSGSFDKIWPGHHKFPIDLKYLDEYAACAKGIMDKSITPKANKGGSLCAEYGRVRIMYKGDYE
jgi:glyoxylase-like metal-dependent hydrolase (beta-lactamase superfamily II)